MAEWIIQVRVQANERDHAIACARERLTREPHGVDVRALPIWEDEK